MRAASRPLWCLQTFDAYAGSATLSTADRQPRADGCRAELHDLEAHARGGRRRWDTRAVILDGEPDYSRP